MIYNKRNLASELFTVRGNFKEGSLEESYEPTFQGKAGTEKIRHANMMPNIMKKLKKNKIKTTSTNVHPKINNFKKIVDDAAEKVENKNKSSSGL